MSKNKKLLIAKFALISAVIPVVIHAYEFGPPERRTGAPGDAGTCLSSGCHTGSTSGPGNVAILLPNGNTYTPGVKQHIKVQITDSTRQKFGFELTARLVSNLAAGQAGDFAPSDSRTQVLCDDGTVKPASGCGQFPVQFIEHTMAGYTASTSGGFTYEFDWTPPATNVGDVRMYVAANAGPGGAPVSNNANIYQANITLSPAAATGGGPTPDPGGIVPAYSSSTTVSSGSWVSIYSTVAKNLAPTTTVWNGDFPTQLGGVTVTFAGKPAYLWFVSQQQINLQVPDGIGTGTMPVVITNANGSTTVNVTVAQTGPSFLLIDASHAAGFVYDANINQTLLGPTGAPGNPRPAKKGEVVAIYGTGFGPTNPVVPSGQLFAGAANMVDKPTITVGGVPVGVDFAGIVAAGLYQFNFRVPQNIPSGDVHVIATAGGLSTQSTVVIPVE